MDEAHFEQAAKIEQNMRDAALAKAKAANEAAHTRPEDFDGACACGEPIPDARLSLGYFTCIDCASVSERRAKLTPT